MRLSMVSQSVLQALQLTLSGRAVKTYDTHHVDEPCKPLWGDRCRVRVNFADLSVDGVKIVPLQPLTVSSEHNTVTRGNITVSANTAKVIIGDQYYILEMKFIVDAISGDTRTECLLFDSHGKLQYQDAEWDGYKQHEAWVANSSC